MIRKTKMKSHIRGTTYDCRRYVFRQGVLETGQSLQKSKGKIFQSRDDFLQYCGGLDTYLKNLAHENQDGDCPFCLLSPDDKQNAYTTSQRAYPFVDHQENHLKLWKDGLVVIPNYDGWHSISELVITREHHASLDFEQKYVYSLLNICLQRWQTHRSHLTKVLPGKIGKKLYHGIVYNQRAGQSVLHLHLHCYSTLHLLEPLPHWLEMPVVHTVQSSPIFKIHLSDDDHPDLIAISQLNEIDLHSMVTPDNICSSMLSISKLINKMSFALYKCIVPASLGWFYIPYPTPYLIYASIPLKRSGTIQSFQGDKFHKFNPDVIKSSMRILIDDLR